MNIPKHVAIILDGNGRWAKEKGLSSLEGHKKGATAIEEITEHARNVGVEYLTFYAFSTENWKRSKDWVEGFFKLLGFFLESRKKRLINEGVCVRFIGNLDLLPKSIRGLMDDLSESTKHLSRIYVNLALNYGSRDEIVRSVKKVVHDVNAQKIKEDDINELLFSTYLDTCHSPEVDLLIRTAGEKRLSNFLLWQLAYSEFMFFEECWPDFTPKLFDHAINLFNQRQRNFGS